MGTVTRHFVVGLVVLVMLAGCGGAAAPAITGQGVLDQFKAAGLTIENIRPTDNTGKPVPQGYQENLTFTTPSLGDKGGQVFVCDMKAGCDAIFAYFDGLKGLAGPYLYQSPSGMVVVQLNSGLQPDEAAKYEAVVKGLP
ncbi:MAG: hypothetical protein ACJ8CR_36850 [Roseiflexaceae bacterium]